MDEIKRNNAILYQSLQLEWQRLIEQKRWTEAERLNHQIAEFVKWRNWVESPII